MNEHLKRAWKYLQEMEAPGKRPSPIQLAVEEIFFCLNALLEAQPQEAPQQLAGGLNMPESQFQNPPSEKPSSPDTEVVGGIRRTYPISSTWSYRASPAGMSLPLVLRDISDWLSSHLPHGPALEVEIGVTLTSKGSTPPAGSLSPSTLHPTDLNKTSSSFSSGAHGTAARHESSSTPGPEREWVRQNCMLCDHPRGDHTLRGNCTWTLCTCRIAIPGLQEARDER